MHRRTLKLAVFIGLVTALMSVSALASARSCFVSTEVLELELVEVTIDGVPLEDLSVYDGFGIELNAAWCDECDQQLWGQEAGEQRYTLPFGAVE